MANTRSAEKNIRKTRKRTLANQTVKARLRTLRKKVQTAITSGDASAAQSSLREFASAADKAAKVHVIHKNTSSRYKSLLAKKIAAIGA
ncbi:MAG: 30S ribosomal protein S20 [Verrucomicrobiales bacterium]|nr:30S ribosomal protein S20 [Verrucomicrobiales bacterium]